jgi:hypothetical protein
MNQGLIDLSAAAQQSDISVLSAAPRLCTTAFCPKRTILVGLVKFLAVGCGLNEQVSMISPKSSCAPEHCPIQIDNLTQAALQSTCWNRSIPLRPFKTRYHSTKQVAKPPPMTSSVLPQTHYPGGLG